MGRPPKEKYQAAQWKLEGYQHTSDRQQQEGRDPARVADHDPDSGTSSEFSFVNISNPSDAGSSERKKFVRQHAAKYIKSSKTSESSQRDGALRTLRPLQVGIINFSRESHDFTPDIKKAVLPKLLSLESEKAQSLQDFSGKGKGRGKHPESSSDDNPRGISWEPSGSSRKLLLSHYYPEATYTEILGMVKKNHSPLAFKLNSSTTTFPIEMDEEAFQLVQFCMHADYGFDRAIPAFRPIWFGMILRDPASFLQQLGTTLAHRNLLRGIEVGGNAVLYQQRALRSVNERLAHPVQGLSDGIIGAVISFLTLDNIIGDGERYKIDKTGLARMIQLRGGIATLEENAEVRLMILWDDVCGACAFDVKPHYGLPTRFLPPVPTKALLPPSHRLLNIIWTWNRLYPERHEFIGIFHDLHIINAIIRVRYPEIFDDPWFLGLQINPIILRLLYPTTVESLFGKTGGQVENACRLAALIYLADLRVKFMVYHITGPHFVQRLKDIVLSEMEEWQGLQYLRLWVLVIGGIKSTEPGDVQVFVGAVASTMGRMKLKTWEEAMQVVTSVLWIDEIYAERAVEFGRIVMDTPHDSNW